MQVNDEALWTLAKIENLCPQKAMLIDDYNGLLWDAETLKYLKFPSFTAWSNIHWFYPGDGLLLDAIT